MIKKLILLKILILTSSCMACINTYKEYKSAVIMPSEVLLLDRENSIIITKINNKITLADPIYEEKWKSLGTGWVSKDNKGFGAFVNFKETQNKFDFYNAKPSQYILENIGNIAMIDQFTQCAFFETYSGSRFALVEKLKFGQIWSNPKNLIGENGDISSYSFSVNPAEIVYIGDINISVFSYWSFLNDKIKIDVVDNYDEAVKEFQKSYPQFKNKKIEKRLVKSGTVFNKDGIAKFFNSPMSLMRDLK